MQLQYRAGRPAPTGPQPGTCAVPLAVLSTEPLLVPTQMIRGSPGATAIALMSPDPGSLIDFHVGRDATLLTSLLRHRWAAPASIRLGLLGSRMNGAMNRAFDPASVIPLKMLI